MNNMPRGTGTGTVSGAGTGTDGQQGDRVRSGVFAVLCAALQESRRRLQEPRPREEADLSLSLFLLFLCLCFRCRCLSHALSLCASPCALCEAIALLKRGRFIVRDFQMDEKEAASGEQDRKKLESDKETLQVRFEFTGRERVSECAIVCCVRRCCCASRSSFLAPICSFSPSTRWCCGAR